MSKAHDRLTDPRTARKMLMIAVVATVLLLFALEPAAAWDTTSMPSSGGGYGTVDWYSPSSDPL